MAKIQWTTDQQKVIDLRKRNILVSAAAGSGKTAVLVERIITMITEGESPVDIDRLLIVTFTNAAAGEMRERIGKAIEKKLGEQPDNVHLQKQMTLLHSAQITTIHSFCLNVIRNHFNVIDLDPGFRVGDEAELKLLKSDVIAELLERKYEEAEEGFLQFVESYATGKSDDGLEEMILQLYEFSMSHPWPVQWLEERRNSFSLQGVSDMEQTPWMTDLCHYISSVLSDVSRLNKRATEICIGKEGPYPYKEAMEADEELIADLKKVNSYEEYYEIFWGISWKRLSTKKDPSISEEKKNMVKGIRDQIKKAITELKKHYFFQSPIEMVDDIQGVEGVMNALIDLAVAFSQDFAIAKQEKNLVDFNDLEHFALGILVGQDQEGNPVPSQVAAELREFYEEILIDEYQDSNMVQETILTSISKEGTMTPNRFMVGDVKQSIYKFRLARPEIFMQKFDSYDLEDSLYQRIDLHKNFRSRGEVLDFVNFVFKQIMTRELGNIEYDHNASLFVGAQFEPTMEPMSMAAELILVTNEESGVGEVLEEEQELSLKELEARAIGAKIKELVNPDTGLIVRKNGGYGKARYKDIVILLRTMSGWAELFAETLMAEGIPAYSDTQTGYFSALEVKTVLNFLKIIDNPRQDIPFTAVLRSPIGGVVDEELAFIKEGRQKEEMYDAVIYYEEMGENQKLRQKLSGFLRQLQELRALVPYTTIHDLIVEIFKRTKYDQYVSVMPGGSRRIGNLNMLLEKAVEFEGTSYKGLFHFNRYIEKLHKYDIDFGEAGITSGNEDTVRIMSIHKSKGLEFPIVFAAGMGKTFNNQDARSKLILHPELGIGPDYIDYQVRVKAPTLIKKVLQKKTVLENLGEELRILYVALTRAEEKLILTGGVKDISKKMDKWKEISSLNTGKMMFHSLSTAGSYLDWVVPAVLDEELLGKENIAFQLQQIGPFDLTKVELDTQMQKKWTKENLIHWDDSVVHDEELLKQLKEREAFSYPFQEDGMIPAKLTVSELKRLSQQGEEEDGKQLYTKKLENEAFVPEFMKTEKVIRGTDIGTLYHKVMECLDFVKVQTEEDVILELRSLVEEGKLRPEEIEAIDRKKILQFLDSDLSKRMAVAMAENRLMREQPFVYGIPANRIDSKMNSKETVLIQGIIDAFFEEEDGLVLIDFKTDRIPKEEMLIERYTTQLDFYQEAIERLTYKKVKERYIYSFFFGKKIKL